MFPWSCVVRVLAASLSMIHGRGDHFTRAVGASSISPCHPLGKVVFLARSLACSRSSSPSPFSFFSFSSGCVYLSEFSGYSARNSSCWHAECCSLLLYAAEKRANDGEGRREGCEMRRRLLCVCDRKKLTWLPNLLFVVYSKAYAMNVIRGMRKRIWCGMRKRR